MKSQQKECTCKKGEKCTCKMKNQQKKAEQTKQVKESLLINQFVKCIVEKNYASANKYLQAINNHKIRNRIEKFANVKI